MVVVGCGKGVEVGALVVGVEGVLVETEVGLGMSNEHTVLEVEESLQVAGRRISMAILLLLHWDETHRS